MSGNSKGRPKGSKNLATILAKAGRQRVRVTENGRTRYITKFEASMLQLVNKAVAGDLKAINELRYWAQLLIDPDEIDSSRLTTEESDVSVWLNIKRRMLQSEIFETQDGDTTVTGGPSHAKSDDAN
jgi:Family of unknown function (DUF5681)